MRYLYVIYAIVTFVILFLILFPFFLLFSLFGSWGRKAIWKLIQIWSYVWFFLIGQTVEKIYQQLIDKTIPYIVVANHCSYIDTPLIFRAIPFFARPLAKFELTKIPLFGFLYRQMAVTIDRNNEKSKAKGVHLLKQTLNEGSSIFIFPEGTFNETEAPLKSFYDGAFRIAKQTNTAILPVVFLDSKKRWHYKSLWTFNPGKNRIVFLPPVPIPEDKNIRTLKDEVYQQMENVIYNYS